MKFLHKKIATLLLCSIFSISIAAQTNLQAPAAVSVSTIDWNLSQRDLSILSSKDVLEKADFLRNKSEIETKANSDDPLANLLMGFAYQDGIGFGKDELKSFQYIEKSAKSGHPRAMNALAIFLEDGFGIAKSLPDAARWYRKSADAGNARGMFGLGQMLSKGLGLPKNDVEAAQLFRKSAEAGFDPAMVSWGYALSDGVGVDIDQQAALKWYLAAAELGNAGGMENVGIMYHAGRGVRQDFTLAHSWYKKGAIAGNDRAMLSLAKSYSYGEGVTKNVQESDRWVRAAAELGNNEAIGLINAALNEEKQTTKAPNSPEPSRVATTAGNGWDVSSQGNFTLAIPPAQPIYGRAGYNCSGGMFSGILVFVPSSFPLFDPAGNTNKILNDSLFVEISKLAPVIYSKSNEKCRNIFRLTVSRIGVYDYCIQNKSECGKGFLPEQSFRFCTDTKNIGVGGTCASRYDIGYLGLYASGKIEGGITLSSGPQTLALKLAEKDRVSQAKAEQVASVQAQAKIQRQSFQKRSLALVPQSQKAAVAAALSHMVSGGSPCFNVYDSGRIGQTVSAIQSCDKFSMVSFLSRAVSNADAANGVTSRAFIRATYIYTKDATANWTDASICYSMVFSGRNGWRVAGNC